MEPNIHSPVSFPVLSGFTPGDGETEFSLCVSYASSAYPGGGSCSERLVLPRKKICHRGPGKMKPLTGEGVVFSSGLVAAQHNHLITGETLEPGKRGMSACPEITAFCGTQLDTEH